MRSGLSEQGEPTVTSSEDFDPSYEPRQGLRNLTHRDADWSGLRILVTGLGISGFAAADALSERGAIVSVVSADATAAINERAQILQILDVDVRLGPEHLIDVPEGT
jgi:UDP-N-acetylmuramoylalanine--D-glutamate ligase